MGMARKVKRTLATAGIVVGATLVGAPPASAALEDTGRWGPLIDWPVIPINSALTPDGKVMTFGTDDSGVQGGQWEFDVWSPTTGAHEVTTNFTWTDLFCSVQILDPIRDVIFTAGGDDSVDGTNNGPTDFTSFSAATGIGNEAPMYRPRWYPTGTLMPNGEIIVEGGSAEGVAGPGVLTPERYTPGVGWTLLNGATSAYAYGDDQNRWWYPRSWVAPNGKIFGISGSNMYYLDPRGDGSVTGAGTFPGGNIGATSTAVMYRPGMILQAGGGAYSNSGGGPGSTAASIVDINGASPVVSPATPMSFGRHWPDATVLPDGDVLVVGGSSANNGTTGVAYQPELWDPDTDSWTVLDPELQMRLYHSTATLLPDGRILVGGGGAPGPQSNLNAQIFEPPYLFDGNGPASRPSITAAPDQLDYGTTFDVDVTADAERATLVRASASTHSFNGGQRFMELPMTGTGTSRTITAPANSAVAPPGYYLLFVLDADGTPSVAEMVELEVPGGGPALVVDGFEDGAVAAPGGYVEYGPGSGFGPWSVTSAVSRDQAAHHGGLGVHGHHLDLDDDGAAGYTVAGLVPGEEYENSLKYARHHATSGPVSANVSIADLDHTWSASNPSDGQFLDLTASFTASATSHTLTVSGVSSTATWGGMVVDDVAIWQAGGPAAIEPLLVDGVEDGATAAYGGWVNYGPGSSFGPWSVTSAVSRDQAAHHGGIGNVGHHLDLDDDGSVNRAVTGLEPGATYRITLRYARHLGTAGPVSANVSIADLDHTWSASNSSDGQFLTLAEEFTASSSSHELTISGVSSTAGCCGAVVDNIVIWQSD